MMRRAGSRNPRTIDHATDPAVADATFPPPVSCVIVAPFTYRQGPEPAADLR
jgi:hypothetical protein